MDSIIDFVLKSPILIILIVVVVALGVSWLNSAPKGTVNPEDIVPHYKRFERRESELGNRRQRDVTPATGEDHRTNGRRASDWFRRKR